jgi:TatD DNase family protein
MKYFNLHTHTASGQPGFVELLNEYPLEMEDGLASYSIGIHPWKITDQTDRELQIIEQKLSDPACWAVGECGLDKRIETPMDVQQKVFEPQLLLAQQAGKPVVIHCVAAYDEVVATKDKLGITVPLILHGFSKSMALARQMIGEGFYLSFGKYLLRNPELPEVFAKVPADRFFLETDTIDEPLTEVYELAAKARGVSIEEIKEQVAANVERVFGRSING